MTSSRMETCDVVSGVSGSGESFSCRGLCLPRALGAGGNIRPSLLLKGIVFDAETTEGFIARLNFCSVIVVALGARDLTVLRAFFAGDSKLSGMSTCLDLKGICC